MDIVKVLVTPKGLLIISFCILIIGKIIFHKDYLSCFSIIKHHMDCFRMENGHISKMSLLLYYFIPLLLAISLIQIRILDDTVVNLITIIISILTAMFFTLLTLILDMRARIRTDHNYNAGDASLSTKLLKETYYSLMFEILISIAILIMCFVELFAKQYSCCASLIIYYLVFILLLNMFMILKRIYCVINKDLEIYR
ncbi:MAG: hypothetical protein HFG49_08415 [Lachnospiraceae bacterium]|jgi:hypothetical protein|nr:hypothetical protein [Lachnospiraceae bacterium]